MAAEAQGVLKSLSSVLMDRFRWGKQHGFTFGGQRDTYGIFGYPQTVTLADYREKYERGGLAKRLVDCFPAATWRGGLQLFEDADPNNDTEFERAWKSINDRLNVWSTLQRVDTLAGLSTYSVLLLGAPGELSEELPKGAPDQLIYMTPYLGGGGARSGNRERLLASTADASIQSYDENIHSPRFGEPLTYTLKRQMFSSPAFDRPVHFSRIIHVAEGGLEDFIWGMPTLQNVFNLLIDLEKISGAGAEAYFLRANQGMILDVDKDMGLPGTTAAGLSPEERTALRDKAEELQHQLQRVMVTRGVSVTQLGSDVANFGPSADAIIKQIAGAKGIPLRILTGAETAAGQEAKDADNWNTQIQDRRTAYAGPCIVRRLVDRLIAYNYLPKPTKYDISWATEEDMSEIEKADYAVKLATTNKTQGKTIVTSDEIREMAFKLQPLTPEQSADYVAPVAPGFGGADEGTQLLEEPQPELKAAGGVGSGIPGHITEPKDRADYAAATKTLNQVLGGPKASSAVRKRANIDTLKRVKTEDLQRLKSAYETLERITPSKFPSSTPLRHVNDELKFRGLESFDTSELKAALRALEVAIEQNDTEAVARIIGLSSTT